MKSTERLVRAHLQHHSISGSLEASSSMSCKIAQRVLAQQVDEESEPAGRRRWPSHTGFVAGTSEQAREGITKCNPQRLREAEAQRPRLVHCGRLTNARL
jgi:hypothetical protein